MATANATVMFTDIRGFTARTSRDTRVGLEELLRTHEQLLLPVIKHYDGRVVKTIGDAFLVVFESPTNAVHCGVVIQSRLREFNGRADDDHKIEVRVAINSGEVALRGDDIFGEPVNIAARIEGITEAGEVYFTEATYLAMTKSEVPSSEVGTRRLKGIPEEIKLYKVLLDEDNALYKRIVESAGIVEHTAAATGSLSVPQWPPRRGALAPSRANTAMLLAWVAGLCVVGGAWFAVQQWREAHRYDTAQALLAAGKWREARTEAGRLFNDRAGDNQAVTLLGTAIRGELQACEAAGELQALQDAWNAARTGYPTLPSLPVLEREVKLATVRLRVKGGEAEDALQVLAQMHAADKSDAEVTAAIATALRADLEQRLKDLTPRTREDFDKRLTAYGEEWGSLPGWPKVRNDAWLAAGTQLVGHSNGWVQQQGSNYLWAFLREVPDDAPRRSDAIALLLANDRFSDWKLLRAAIAADPALAGRADVREGVLRWVGERYDWDGADWNAARELLVTHWAADVQPTLREWLDAPPDPKRSSQHIYRRCGAYLILEAAKALTPAEQDRHQAWVLLQLSSSSYEAEMLGAIRHWSELLAADRADAVDRAAAAVPNALPAVEALDRGVWEKNDQDHGKAWRAVVSACFYSQARAAMLAAVADSRYASERATARLLLAEHGDLDGRLATRSYLRSLQDFDGRWFSQDVRDAVEYFRTVDAAQVPDRAAVADALAEVLALINDRLAGIENNARMSATDKRRESAWWLEGKTAVEAVAGRYPKD